MVVSFGRTKHIKQMQTSLAFNTPNKFKVAHTNKKTSATPPTLAHNRHTPITIVTRHRWRHRRDRRHQRGWRRVCLFVGMRRGGRESCDVLLVCVFVLVKLMSGCVIYKGVRFFHNFQLSKHTLISKKVAIAFE